MTQEKREWDTHVLVDGLLAVHSVLFTLLFGSISCVCLVCDTMQHGTGYCGGIHKERL